MLAPKSGRLLEFFFVLTSLLAGCQSMQDMLASAPKPKAHVVGVSIRGLSLENIVLLFDVEVENPYSTALPLADLGYTLSSSGKKFLDGSLKPSGRIPAQGKQVLQVPATVQFASLSAVVKGLKPGSVLPYTADFRMGVDAPVIGHVDVPFSRNGELPVPAVPQVELVSLGIGKLGLDQVSATAKLQIHNTNQFPLDLTRLGVTFALGGQEVGGSKLASAMSLPAGKDSVVELPLSFSPRAAGLGLVNLLRGNQIAYKVAGSLDANTRFGPLSLPFSHIGNTAVTR
ncbi:MAG TPA: LEA type 2 family protein [Burkholderiales bacterium]|nr:LEA type 2 family protein [Burkholderiales bacterium]